ncbi:MAG: isoaspartyl dipeptidase with L-asparaginase activity [Microbacterium sp. 69-10]|uniref:isoaspartyl peptidase/L-asparaginase family protein n=1 Tax=Microbacterium sp. 69-10 TaxID=1895783 RepID=UPI000965D263|nr:isoaspartyl peptidase/L-asparaginase [Microbacterium sp. 69-10]OJU41288.1 MAG: isoaspartyl dipeptidase with L-asparaginase activity [Microbacterium sp. 69-10]
MNVFESPGGHAWSLAIHGGAGGRVEELGVQGDGEYEQGLADAHRVGARVLEDGGSALDAVCAAVAALEDNPLFNAGRGSALRRDGSIETDAAVMFGGRAGAVAALGSARNPVAVARRIMEDHAAVLRTGVTEEAVRSWGLETADTDYFLTPGRIAQLDNVQAGRIPAQTHGTVGAVAMDRNGRLAAATSTGGMVNQVPGRIGDTPLVGAGTYARDGVVAVSCTGSGEAFIQGVVAHEIAARVRHAGADLADAVRDVLHEEVGGRGVTGGIIAVGADGRVVVAHNSPAMFAATGRGADVTVWS